MDVSEFTEALCFAFDLTDGTIVGFRAASSGLIVTPSQICSCPESLCSEEYEILLKPSPNSQRSRFIQEAEDDVAIEQPVHQSRVFQQPNYYGGNLLSPPSVHNQRQTRYQNMFQEAQEDTEEDIIDLAMQLPTDYLLTEKLKQRIIQLVHMKDKGILGAFMLYMDDRDFEGFKARVLHKVLSPQVSREVRNENASSASTAGFSYPATAVGRNRRVQQNSHDKFMPVILELERKSLLDEQHSSLLKTLILEENIDVQRVINSYLARVISEKELSFKLTRLAQQLGTYFERPQSPLPKRKSELLSYVNSLARYHFNAEDIQLLQKLIHDENEFILSTFDVFESDKDHENLIDSLQRILEKSRQMGLHTQPVTASSFYNETYQGWPTTAAAQRHQSLPARNVTMDQRVGSQSTGTRRYFQNERPPTTIGRVRLGNIDVPHKQKEASDFTPTTTVHDVALIPNYFSSGEEDHGTHQQNQHTVHLYHTRKPLQQMNQSQQVPRQTSEQRFHGDSFGQFKQPMGLQQMNTTSLSNYRGASQGQRLESRGYGANRSGANKRTVQSISNYYTSVSAHEIPGLVNETQADQLLMTHPAEEILIQENYNDQVPKSESFDQMHATQMFRNTPVSRYSLHEQVGTYSQKTNSHAGAPRNEYTQHMDNSFDSEEAQVQLAGNWRKIDFGALGKDGEPFDHDNIEQSKSGIKRKKSDKKSKHKKHKRRRRCSTSSSKSSSTSSSSSSSESDSSDSSSVERKRKSKHKKNRQAKKGASDSRKKEKKSKSKKQKKEKQKSAKNTAESPPSIALDKAQILAIMDEEGIESTMRPDCYVMLMNEINTGLNPEVLSVFRNYANNKSSTILLSRLLGVSEDILQAFLEVNFSNSEIGAMIKLRMQKDPLYMTAFMGFGSGKDKGDKEILIESLREAFASMQNQSAHGRRASNSNLTQKQNDYLVGNNNTRKQNAEDIFQMVYQTDFINTDEGPALKQAFDKDESTLLLDIIEDYKRHNDYLKMKNQLHTLGQDLLQDFQPKSPEDVNLISMQDALCWFSEKKLLQQSEILTLQSIQNQMLDGHQHILAIWEAYQVQEDRDDMLGSLKVLLRCIGKNSQTKKNQNSPDQITNKRSYRHQGSEGQEDRAEADHEEQEDQFEREIVPNNPQNESQRMGQFRLFNTQIDDQTKPEEEHGSNDEQKTPSRHEISDGAEEDDNSDVETDFEKICEYQHKILRKYTMLGMINYSDAPQFHSLVEQRDYRMICIFEVYSQNRLEDDFVENLGLIAQVMKDQENSSGGNESPEEPRLQPKGSPESGTEDFERRQREPQVESDEDIEQEMYLVAAVKQFQERALLDQETASWSINAWNEGDRKLQAIWGAHLAQPNQADLIHSIKRYYQRRNPTPKPVVSDQFLAKISELKNSGEINEAVHTWCAAKRQASDGKLNAIFGAFLSSKDHSDFVHSLKRYHQKSNQQYA